MSDIKIILFSLFMYINLIIGIISHKSFKDYFEMSREKTLIDEDLNPILLSRKYKLMTVKCRKM
jgi:hypothetical protein